MLKSEKREKLRNKQKTGMKISGRSVKTLLQNMPTPSGYKHKRNGSK